MPRVACKANGKRDSPDLRIRGVKVKRVEGQGVKNWVRKFR